MDTRKFSRRTPGVLPGETTAPAPEDLAQAAVIRSVSAAGAKFELTDTPGYLYGPAPWGLAGYASFSASITGGHYPHVGDTALIVFAGAGIGRPVVLAWWR